MWGNNMAGGADGKSIEAGPHPATAFSWQCDLDHIIMIETILVF